MPEKKKMLGLEVIPEGSYATPESVEELMSVLMQTATRRFEAVEDNLEGKTADNSREINRLDGRVDNVEIQVLKTRQDLEKNIREIELKHGVDGLDGVDADEGRIITEVLKKIKIPEQKVESVVADSPEQLVEKLHQSETKIKRSAIEGLDEFAKNVETAINDSGRMRAGPGGTNLRILNNGQPIGDTISELNFINPTTITYTTGTAGRRANVDYSSGSGPEAPTSGVVNGTNQTFTFSNEPLVISVDQGRFMRRVSSDGTVNWTIVGTTVTLTVAPTFDIFSL